MYQWQSQKKDQRQAEKEIFSQNIANGYSKIGYINSPIGDSEKESPQSETPSTTLLQLQNIKWWNWN